MILWKKFTKSAVALVDGDSVTQRMDFARGGSAKPDRGDDLSLAFCWAGR